MRDHDYAPPEGFVDAVLHGPMPSTADYLRLAEPLYPAPIREILRRANMPVVRRREPLALSDTSRSRRT
jgi:hypothetical protein